MLYCFHEFVDSSFEYLFNKFGAPKTVIEIGCYQGYFTFNMTNFIAAKNPNYKHICIDPFDHSPDIKEEDLKNAYKVFQNTLDTFPYKDNIWHIKKNSWDGLLQLINENVKAELIYIDGNHTSPVVLQDLVLSFELLKSGGAILCDDSVTWGGDQKLQDTPRLAVDSFVHCFWDKIHVLNLPNSYQTCFIKK